MIWKWPRLLPVFRNTGLEAGGVAVAMGQWLAMVVVVCICPLQLFFLVPLSWCFRVNPVTPSLLSLHGWPDGTFGGVILTHCSGLLSVWL